MTSNVSVEDNYDDPQQSDENREQLTNGSAIELTSDFPSGDIKSNSDGTSLDALVGNQELINVVRNKISEDRSAVFLLQIVSECLRAMGSYAPMLVSEDEVLSCMTSAACSDEALMSALDRQCHLCLTKATIHSLVLMICCNCALCQECFRVGYVVCLKESGIRRNPFACLVCQKPDNAVHDPLHVQFIMQQSQQIIPALSDEIEARILRVCLESNDDFMWCSHCDNGFMIADVIDGEEVGPVSIPIRCDICMRETCSRCKMQWDDYHKNDTCPKLTNEKVTKTHHIATGTTVGYQRRPSKPTHVVLSRPVKIGLNFVKCPRCHACMEKTGGCLHIACPKCHMNFCASCQAQFFRSIDDCNKCRTIAKKRLEGETTLICWGFHAHHPRNCFYYLRDFTVTVLIQFVDNNVQLSGPLEKLIIEYVQTFGDGKRTQPNKHYPEQFCHILVQTELPSGAMMDAVCGKAVKRNFHTSICDYHCKDFLVRLIVKHRVDPVGMYDVEDLKRMVVREGYELPVDSANADTGLHTDSTGTIKCSEKVALLDIVKQYLPL